MKAEILFGAMIAIMVGLVASPALAYVEIGFFTVVLQSIVAVVVGALVALKLYWKKFAAGMRQLRRGSTADDPTGVAEDE